MIILMTSRRYLKCIQKMKFNHQLLIMKKKKGYCDGTQSNLSRIATQT